MPDKKIKTKEDITSVGIPNSEGAMIEEFNDFLKEIFKGEEFKIDVQKRAKEEFPEFITNFLALREEVKSMQTPEEIKSFRYVQYIATKPLLDSAMESVEANNPLFDFVEVSEFIATVLSPALLTHTDEQIQDAFDKYLIAYKGEYAITVEEFIKKYLELENALNNAILSMEELDIAKILEFFAVCNIIEEQNFFIESLAENS